MIYCVIPRELEAELYDKMVEYYEDNPNVTVIVDRRDGPDRRDGQDDGSSSRSGARSRDRRRAARAGHVPATTEPAGRAEPASATIGRDGDGRPRPSSRSNPVDRRGDRDVPALDARPTSTAPSRPRARRGRTGGSSRRPSAATSSSASPQLLEQHKPELSELMTREMGKVKAEAGGDVQEAIDMSYYMGGEGRRLFGQTTPSELRDKFMMSVRMPVGVVGAITPWNFPIAIPAWKLCPALVCGNTVVLKPAEDTPLLAQRFVDLLHEAGLPEGVVKIVHGFGEEAGDALVRHPDVPVITFTGSRETGVAVTKAAADQLKHVHLELGGKNAIIVMDDADVDLAVDGIVWSAFGTAGQRCTAASRVIVHAASTTSCSRSSSRAPSSCGSARRGRTTPTSAR